MRSNASSDAKPEPSTAMRMSSVPTGVRSTVCELAIGPRKGVGAGDGLRTRYLNLGKVALYRVSYSRVPIGAHVTQRRRPPLERGLERRHALLCCEGLAGLTRAP